MFPFSLMGWVGLCLLFLAIGLLFGNIVLLAGALFLLLTVLLSTMPQPPEKIVAERKVPREICWAGDVMEVERRLTLSGGFGAIFVHDYLPTEMEVVEVNNFHLFWKWPGIAGFDLSYRVRFDKRGELTLPATAWTSQAHFGIRRPRAEPVGPSITVSVVPRIRGITRLKEIRVATKQPRYRVDLSQTRTANSEFRELRPYAPGDPIKIINWKASSRGARSDNLPC